MAKQETSKLWRPFREAIRQKEGLAPKKFYSIANYGKTMAQGIFSPETNFEKIAAITESLDLCPANFEEIRLQGGLYAVFSHQGSALKFQETLNLFIHDWLPSSNYQLDEREHFEIFDETYDPFSEDSVELAHLPIIEKVTRE